ncbi:hypothetical protein DIPPA_09557 [Diplonema papillatum]|nr:hypothetical protein DIPPA_09557 [Diplonema papillatum]
MGNKPGKPEDYTGVSGMALPRVVCDVSGQRVHYIAPKTYGTPDPVLGATVKKQEAKVEALMALEAKKRGRNRGAKGKGHGAASDPPAADPQDEELGVAKERELPCFRSNHGLVILPAPDAPPDSAYPSPTTEASPSPFDQARRPRAAAPACFVLPQKNSKHVDCVFIPSRVEEAPATDAAGPCSPLGGLGGLASQPTLTSPFFRKNGEFVVDSASPLTPSGPGPARRLSYEREDVRLKRCAMEADIYEMAGLRPIRLCADSYPCRTGEVLRQWDLDGILRAGIAQSGHFDPSAAVDAAQEEEGDDDDDLATALPPSVICLFPARDPAIDAAVAAAVVTAAFGYEQLVEDVGAGLLEVQLALESTEAIERSDVATGEESEWARFLSEAKTSRRRAKTVVKQRAQDTRAKERTKQIQEQVQGEILRRRSLSQAPSSAAASRPPTPPSDSGNNNNNNNNNSSGNAPLPQTPGKLPQAALRSLSPLGGGSSPSGTPKLTPHELAQNMAQASAEEARELQIRVDRRLGSEQREASADEDAERRVVSATEATEWDALAASAANALAPVLKAEQQRQKAKAERMMAKLEGQLSNAPPKKQPADGAAAELKAKTRHRKKLVKELNEWKAEFKEKTGKLPTKKHLANDPEVSPVYKQYIAVDKEIKALERAAAAAAGTSAAADPPEPQTPAEPDAATEENAGDSLSPPRAIHRGWNSTANLGSERVVDESDRSETPSPGGTTRWNDSQSPGVEAPTDNQFVEDMEDGVQSMVLRDAPPGPRRGPPPQKHRRRSLAESDGASTTADEASHSASPERRGWGADGKAGDNGKKRRGELAAELNTWKQAFAERTGRQPKAKDLKRDPSIQDAYREYEALKQAAAQQRRGSKAGSDAPEPNRTTAGKAENADDDEADAKRKKKLVKELNAWKQRFLEENGRPPTTKELRKSELSAVYEEYVGLNAKKKAGNAKPVDPDAAAERGDRRKSGAGGLEAPEEVSEAPAALSTPNGAAEGGVRAQGGKPLETSPGIREGEEAAAAAAAPTTPSQLEEAADDATPTPNEPAEGEVRVQSGKPNGTEPGIREGEEAAAAAAAPTTPSQLENSADDATPTPNEPAEGEVRVQSGKQHGTSPGIQGEEDAAAVAPNTARSQFETKAADDAAPTPNGAAEGEGQASRTFDTREDLDDSPRSGLPDGKTVKKAEKQRRAVLAQQLNEWKKAFAAENGRPPSKKDIKRDPAVAALFQEYEAAKAGAKAEAGDPHGVASDCDQTSAADRTPEARPPRGEGSDAGASPRKAEKQRRADVSRRLNEWKQSFAAENGRPPSKKDIKQDPEIFALFQEYEASRSKAKSETSGVVSDDDMESPMTNGKAEGTARTPEPSTKPHEGVELGATANGEPTENAVKPDTKKTEKQRRADVSRRLNEWKQSFAAENGRPPSKKDIKQNPEIFALFQEYEASRSKAKSETSGVVSDDDMESPMANGKAEGTARTPEPSTKPHEGVELGATANREPTENAVKPDTKKAEKQRRADVSRRLNEWKQNFATENGRPPSKKDIKQDPEIFALFQEYEASRSKAKSEASEAHGVVSDDDAASFMTNPKAEGTATTPEPLSKQHEGVELDATAKGEPTENAGKPDTKKAEKQRRADVSRRLNEWKQNFATENGRPPSKKDIKQDPEIFALFQEYEASRSTAKSETTGVLSDDDMESLMANGKAGGSAPPRKPGEEGGDTGSAATAQAIDSAASDDDSSMSPHRGHSSRDRKKHLVKQLNAWKAKFFDENGRQATAKELKRSEVAGLYKEYLEEKAKDKALDATAKSAKGEGAETSEAE